MTRPFYYWNESGQSSERVSCQKRQVLDPQGNGVNGMFGSEQSG
jgi:hypothetical protein